MPLLSSVTRLGNASRIHTLSYFRVAIEKAIRVDRPRTNHANKRKLLSKCALSAVRKQNGDERKKDCLTRMNQTLLEEHGTPAGTAPSLETIDQGKSGSSHTVRPTKKRGIFPIFSAISDPLGMSSSTDYVPACQ